MVCRGGQAAPVAGCRNHALGRPRLRDHGPADAAGPGRAGLADLAAPLADPRGAGGRVTRGGGPAWGRLGYPRRALRLHDAAGVIVINHGGAVPHELEALRALPGVGDYTAAAVACFAFGQPTTVLDTNVRRVLARVLQGRALPPPHPTAAERALAEHARPTVTAEAVVWNVAAMELGALVCTARAPRCGQCPVADLCAWRRAGSPAYDGPARRGQPWAGTDRQCRGALLQALREGTGPVGAEALASVWPDEPQRMRCLDALVADGLVEPLAGDQVRLPAHPKRARHPGS